MINFFRQLTLPWMLASLIILSFTGGWYHYESKLIQQSHVRQYVASLQLSVSSILQHDNAALIEAKLTHLRHASAIPIDVIAIVTSKNQLIAKSGNITNLAQLTVDKSVSQLTLKKLGPYILALQPISNAIVSDGDSAISSQEQKPYLVKILFKPSTQHSIWVLPVTITALIGLIVLFVLRVSLEKSANRLRTDVSLIAHKLSQIKQGQKNINISEETVPEIAPLCQAVNQLSLQMQLNMTLSENNLLELEEHCKTLQSQNDVLALQLNQLKLANQHVLDTQKAQLQQLQRLLQHASQITNFQFMQALSNYLAVSELLYQPRDAAPDWLLLTDVVGQSLREFYQHSVDTLPNIDVLEAADNLRYSVKIEAGLFTALINAVLQISAFLTKSGKATINIKLDKGNSEAFVYIRLSGDGDGLSEMQLQELTSSDTNWYWPDLALQLLKLLVQKLDARFDLKTLQGIGSSVEIVVPVCAVRPEVIALPESLLVIDTQLQADAELKKTLTELSKNVVVSTSLEAALQRVQQHEYDSVLIFLPEPESLTRWQDLFSHLVPQRSILLAKHDTLPVWQQAFETEISLLPFSLTELYTNFTERRKMKLLVVDDNDTNLAFVKILLKEQPVEIFTASSGADAIAQCQQQVFDILLLDIQLPDIHGTEVSTVIRSFDNYHKVPILAFTAHALEAEVNSFLAAGMDDVIVKPLDVTKIRQVMKWCNLSKVDNISH